jgi:Sec-independent protein translocase protein TatA
VFGVSMWELILILVVALIVLGPRQMTETAKIIGKLYRDLLHMTSDLRNSIDLDLTSSTGSDYRPPTYQPPSQSRPTPQAMEPGEKKTGPDFYAELLEKPDEEETKTHPQPQNPPESGEQKAAQKSGEQKEKGKG